MLSTASSVERTKDGASLSITSSRLSLVSLPSRESGKLEYISPSSIPSDIFCSVIALSLSPFFITLKIGLQPRYFGRSEG